MIHKNVSDVPVRQDAYDQQQLLVSDGTVGAVQDPWQPFHTYHCQGLM